MELEIQHNKDKGPKMGEKISDGADSRDKMTWREFAILWALRHEGRFPCMPMKVKAENR